jgi:hypothetical protein
MQRHFGRFGAPAIAQFIEVFRCTDFVIRNLLNVFDRMKLVPRPRIKAIFSGIGLEKDKES